MVERVRTTRSESVRSGSGTRAFPEQVWAVSSSEGGTDPEVGWSTVKLETRLTAVKDL